MERRQIEYFVAVAKSGSLRAAADVLHVTQPALSQSIRQLETAVGCELFHRVARGMVLTTAGNALYEPASRILHDFEVAQAAIDSVVGLTGGSIEIATLPGLVIDPLAEWICTFLDDAPRVKVSVQQLDEPHEVVAAVRRGSAEIGLALDVPEDRPHEHLVTRHVGEMEIVAVLPPASRVGDDVSIRELLRFRTIVGNESSISTSLISREDLTTLTTGPLVNAYRRETILSLLLSGVGAGLLPRGFAEIAAMQGAIVRPLRPPVTQNISLLYRDAPLTPAGRAFITRATGRGPARGEPR